MILMNISLKQLDEADEAMVNVISVSLISLTGQYTAWLLLPSFVGLLVFLYGLATIKSPDNQDA